MTAPPASLPDDPEALKKIIGELTNALGQSEQQIRFLREQLNIHLAKRFGPSSEKAAPDQLGLFNEAEASAEPDEAPDEAEPSDTPVAAHARKRPGRKPLPDYLPRVRIEHDLSEAEQQCPCGCGAMRRIGEETSEQLDVIPAQVQVLQHVRFKYACPVCTDGVTTAALPPQPIPKSNASPGLLAYIATAKYVDALPLYRQQAILERASIEISRVSLIALMEPPMIGLMEPPVTVC